MNDAANDNVSAGAAARIEAALETLLARLEAAAPQSAPGDDAIDRIRAAPPRTTGVRSLRDEPVLARFRQEAVDGLIRADTVLLLLDLISRIVAARGV